MNTHRRFVIAIVLSLALLVPAGQADAKPKQPPAPTLTYSDVIVEGVADPVHVKVSGVNHAGVVAGYSGTAYATTGFVKPANTAAVTSFGVTGGVGTEVISINDGGAVVGDYFTQASGTEPFIAHAFIRAADGSVTTFDDPALVTTGLSVWGTVATGITAGGIVVGYSFTVGPDQFAYPDGGTELVTHYHGFIRSSSGIFTTYDVPGAASDGAPSVGTRLLGINSSGTAMVGAYTYLMRTPDGPQPMNAGFMVKGRKVTKIVDPNPSVGKNSCAWHEPTGINDAGLIVGNSGNGCGGFHEAWLYRSGAFYTLAHPDYPSTLANPITISAGVNNDGVIAGSWGEGTMFGESHGFTAQVS